jgi:DNA damage-binding protein 1
MTNFVISFEQHEEGAIEELARDNNSNWMTAVEMINDDIYVGAENSCNLFTVRKKSDAATDEERGRLEVVGEYHLGDFVSRFCHGSLRLPDSEMGQIPTVIFSTINGGIGIIASLPHDHYLLLEKLQATLVKFIKGVGSLSHEQWRSVVHSDSRKPLKAPNFLDGDLIESFLDLSMVQMEEVAKAMALPVKELSKRVEGLASLH